MNFSDSLEVLRRHKVLTLVLLALTLFGAGYTGFKLPWTYKASITETLVDSQKSSAVLGGGNPFLSFNSAMVEMANLLAVKLTSNENTAALEQRGYTASFQAQVLSENAETEEPFIEISVSGSNEPVVVQTLHAAAASLRTMLTQLQISVPTVNRLTVQTIAEVAPPVRSPSAKIKPAVGFLGLGLLLSFFIPQVIDGSGKRRRKTPDGSRDEPDRFRPRHSAEDTFRTQQDSPRRPDERHR